MEIAFILLPFFTGLLCYLFRRYLGTTAITWISLQSLGVSLLILVYNLIDVFTYSPYKSKIISLSFPWIKINNVEAEWSLLLDSISLSMSFLILFITFLVQTYSLDYMRDDINKAKFFVYLLFFAFFMLLFVTSGNIMQMFVGWEGVGLVSFLLINFWHTRLEANRSAIQAILFNKIGDIGFYFFIIAVFFLVNSFDIVVIRELIPYYTNYYFDQVSFHFFDIFSLPRTIDVGNRITEFFQFYFEYAGTRNVSVIWFIGFKENDFRFSFCELCCFFVIIAAAGKSAQLGLHGWLPSAMEGGEFAFLKFHYMRETPEDFWSTQKHYFCSEKSKIIGQSAGNQILFINKVGSSETIRETLDNKLGSLDNKNLDLDSNLDLNLANLDLNFLNWLIGFTEGDGSFIINSKYLEFKITQHSNDAQILFLIKKKLGFGSVSIQDYKIVNNKKLPKTHHYRVRNKKGLLKIIELFNGNLLTVKYRLKFNDFLCQFNLIYNEQIQIKSFNNKVSLNNAWLCGFTDAEGCFTISVLDNRRVFVRFILSQKGEKELMQNIANLLKGKVLKSYEGYQSLDNEINNMTVHL